MRVEQTAPAGDRFELFDTRRGVAAVSHPVVEEPQARPSSTGPQAVSGPRTIRSDGPTGRAACRPSASIKSSRGVANDRRLFCEGEHG